MLPFDLTSDSGPLPENPAKRPQLVPSDVHVAQPVVGKSRGSWQQHGAPQPATSWTITNQHRQRLGDIYNPGTGRLQIRNNHRQIIGYIERDGTVTNTSRQRDGTKD